MTDFPMQGCVDCKKFIYTLDIELVDELDQPIPAIDYDIVLEDKNLVLKTGKSGRDANLVLPYTSPFG
ncbi:MAG: hypothetical protein ACRCYF_06115 [Shewanella sp.]